MAMSEELKGYPERTGWKYVRRNISHPGSFGHNPTGTAQLRPGFSVANVAENRSLLVSDKQL